MHNKLFSFLYGINILAQAIFTLITPAALTFLISWLFISKVGAPSWLYAILIPIGVIAGLVSMVKFVIAATTNLERLEKNNKGNNQDD